MARQQSVPNIGNRRRTTSALIVLAMCYAPLVLAAKPDATLCKETQPATLDIPAAELAAKIVHHETSLAVVDETAAAMQSNDLAPTRYFAPQAEAAISRAFENSDNIVFERSGAPASITVHLTPITVPVPDSDTTTETTETKPVEKKPDINISFPGMSDDELVRYKKQMFRRDI